jgi:enoyl-CoA hydratase/carnithine racemase
MAGSYSTLSLRRDGPVIWCTLNRPDALNALSRQLVNDLRAFYGELSKDVATRVVVLRGAGRAFCAGLDLKEGGAEEAGAGTVSGGLNASLDMNSMDAVVAMEDRNQILCAQTSDFREGIVAFLQKRKPAWKDA